MKYTYAFYVLTVCFVVVLFNVQYVLHVEQPVKTNYTSGTMKADPCYALTICVQWTRLSEHFYAYLYSSRQLVVHN